MKNSKWFLVGVALGLVVFVVIMWVLFESGQIYLPSPPPSAQATELTYSAVREIATPTNTQAAYWARVGGTDMVWSACVDGLNCDENMVAIYPDAGLVNPDWQYATANPGRRVIWQNNNVGGAYELATITPQPTNTPTVTPTETPIPVIDKCVLIVWDKGTEFAGLNLRESPSMKNDNRYTSDNPLGYLYRGNVFEPLDIVCNLEGCFAQYSNNGWAAMKLADGKVYSIIVECP